MNKSHKRIGFAGLVSATKLVSGRFFHCQGEICELAGRPGLTG